MNGSANITIKLSDLSTDCPLEFGNVTMNFYILFLLIKLGVYGELTVETSTGPVQGHLLKSYKGRKFAAFEGIPYAKPPIGDLRFRPPEPIDKWNDVLVANTTYLCLQYMPIKPFLGVKGSEDCLYLYVYVPGETIDLEANLDVVVHIHGGAFMLGSPKWMARPGFLMDYNVIVVSFNYRLAAFGFLSTDDEVVPGNNGLKDQVLAMKWIKDNIKNFGGNPDSITLTGLSAGGASVHYHYLSKISRGLFHRGLSQSGTVLQSWALAKKPLKNAKAIANICDCDSDSNQEMIDCLRKVPAEKIADAVKKLFVFSNVVPYSPFAPVVETQPDGFLTEHPYKLLKDKEVYDVPWISTNVKDEGILPVGVFLLAKEMENLNANWTELAPYCLDFHDTVEDPEKPEISNKIRDYYFKDEPIGKDNIYTSVKLFSDRMFFFDGESAIRLHNQATESPVYHYFFTYLPQQRFFFPMEPGVPHSIDTTYLFQFIFTPVKYSPKDEKMMEMMTAFLVDYAKTGVPKMSDVEWLPVTPGANQIDYLHIKGPDDVEMETKEELAPREFWQSLHIKENGELFD